MYAKAVRSGSIVRSSIAASRVADPGPNPGRSTNFQLFDKFICRSKSNRVLPQFDLALVPPCYGCSQVHAYNYQRSIAALK